ncbi:MAG TPA: nitroreductase family protein [Spirochaetia bacterium]|nr:nitroreductase family protein [Spirochaetia bacterium]
MDLLEAVTKRRSVRRYRVQDVPVDLVFRILDAGRMAPSGGNMQPWEFILVRDRSRIAGITDTTFLGFNRETGPKQSWIASVPILIVVCTDFKRTVARYGPLGKRVALMDTSAAIENMLLAATSLGLASCWVSGFDPERLSALFGTPAHVEPVALLPLGYPADLPPAPNKLDLADLLHYERYGNFGTGGGGT